ncbi:MAG: hypothetical protein Q7Q73_00665 [Verrucomicrobiota bacterium JB024]|nr:hypothetical protein [Verrucomicrobiota bacterium JB024]
MGCAGLVCGALGLAAGLCALFFDFFISPSLDYDSPFNYLTTFFWLFNTLLIGLAVCFIAAGLMAKEPDPAAPRPSDQPPPLPLYGRGFAVMPGFSGGLVTPAVTVPPLPVPSEAPPPVSAEAEAGEGEAPSVAPAGEGNVVSGLQPGPEQPATSESTPGESEPEKTLSAPDGEPPAGKEAAPDTSSSSGSPAEGDELPFPEQPPRKNPLG